MKPYLKDSSDNKIYRLKKAMETANAIIVGAGSGLSTSAGFTYSGERFRNYFFDFIDKFGIQDIYSGGFYPFPEEEIKWAWWARHIYYNRYVNAPKPVYQDLLKILSNKNYFVITTNVDHQFQRAGFDKSRLFYTQGDYGLFQSTNPNNKKTYDNEEWVIRAMEVQGFERDSEGVFHVPEDRELTIKIPSEMIPVCIDDDHKMTMNLRADSSFVEDDGWHKAASRYKEFLRRNDKNKVLYLELGVGGNTPGIIKYPFWRRLLENKNSVYVCINYDEAVCPQEIQDRSVCIKRDIGEVLKKIMEE